MGEAPGTRKGFRGAAIHASEIAIQMGLIEVSRGGSDGRPVLVWPGSMERQGLPGSMKSLKGLWRNPNELSKKALHGAKAKCVRIGYLVEPYGLTVELYLWIAFVRCKTGTALM